jgi:DNA-directed RNA polymerase specialized sigma24 family protein
MAPFEKEHRIVLNFLCGSLPAARTSPVKLFSGRMSEATEWRRIRRRKGDVRLKADVSIHLPDEIADLIRALTDAQWIRLRKVSAYFGWVPNVSGDDLLQEAFCRALAGSRKCPKDVDLVKFLVEAMRSIANGEVEKVENEVDFIPVVQPGARVDGAVDAQDSKESQEEGMMAAESDEAIRRALLGLFPADRQACDLVDGILTGYEGEELRALSDLDEKGYASKRRFMRRTIDKHYPQGRKP